MIAEPQTAPQVPDYFQPVFVVAGDEVRAVVTDLDLGVRLTLAIATEDDAPAVRAEMRQSLWLAYCQRMH